MSDPPSARSRLEELPWSGGLLDAVGRASGRPFRVSLLVDGSREIVHDSLRDAQAVERRRYEGAELTAELELGAFGAGEEPDGRPEVEVEVELDRADLIGAAVGHLVDSVDLLLRRGRELRDRREEIGLLTFISQTLGSVIRLDEAAAVILGKLVDVTGADRATLWSHVPENDELRLLATRGRADPAVRSVAVANPASLVAHVWRAQEPVLAGPEPGAMEGLPAAVRQGFEGHALLAVPVTYAPPEGTPRRVGVLNLVGAPGDPSFTSTDRELVAAIASQVGAALENGRLVREELTRERLRAELRLAHDLQLRLLPDPGAFDDLFDVAARCDPADSVGGDFYQLVRLPGRRLGVLLGDVSSHGISAALVMAQLMGAASLVAPVADDPGTVLRRLRDQVAPELEEAGMLVTVFYGVLDAGDGTLRYANAGHPHAFLLRGRSARRLGALDRPVGTPGDGRFDDRVVALEEGDRLLLFTDGLFEGSERAPFRGEAAVTAAATEEGGSAREVLEAVFGYAAGFAVRDDRTALVIRVPASRGGEP